MRIVTYRGAHHDGQISLCAACSERPPWPLGPVSHGEHWGDCDGAECAEQAADDQAYREAMVGRRR